MSDPYIPSNHNDFVFGVSYNLPDQQVDFVFTNETSQIAFLRSDNFTGEIGSAEFESVSLLESDNFTGEVGDTGLSLTHHLESDNFTGEVGSLDLECLILISYDSFTGEVGSLDLEIPIYLESNNFTGKVGSLDLECLILVNSDSFTGEVGDTGLSLTYHLESDNFTGEVGDTGLSLTYHLESDNFTGEISETGLSLTYHLESDSFTGEVGSLDLEIPIYLESDNFTGKVGSLDLECLILVNSDSFTGEVGQFDIQIVDPTNFVFFCEYVTPSQEVNFTFPEISPCSQDYIYTGENCNFDLQIETLLSLDSYIGENCNFDLQIETLVLFDPSITAGEICELTLTEENYTLLLCSVSHFDIATLGITSDPANIANQGYNVQCQNLDFITGCNATIQFAEEQEQQLLSSSGYTGESSFVNLTHESIRYGSSEIEVIDIIDSRQEIIFTITINNHKFKKVFKKEVIYFDKIIVKIDNVKFKRNSIEIFIENLKCDVKKYLFEIKNFYQY